MKNIELTNNEIEVLDTLIEYLNENWSQLSYYHSERIGEDIEEEDFDSLVNKIRG